MDEVTTQEVGTSQQLAALYGALAAAQGEFQPIVKNRDVEIRMREGGKYRFKYADLEEITAKTRPALAKHGLATSQPIVKLGTGTALRTMLVHKDGGMLFSEIPLPASTNGGDIKNYGATLTYLRRYAKTAILDVAADDDLDENGEPAGDNDQGAQASQQQQQPKQGGRQNQLQTYTDQQFSEQLPNWKAAIDKGTKPETIIKTISSKYALTEEQTQAIKSLSEAAA